jgi:hypothetical protein
MAIVVLSRKYIVVSGGGQIFFCTLTFSPEQYFVVDNINLHIRLQLHEYTSRKLAFVLFKLNSYKFYT